MMIFVMSELEFEKSTAITEKDLVISIVSPGRAHPRPTLTCLARLNLSFKDTMWGEDSPLGFSTEQAQETVDFVEGRLLDCENIFVHCEAGMSRSAGVAVGFARYLLTDEDENKVRDSKPHFNLFVAQKIWKVYIKKLGE
jgi:predicted protein tyrosine phosphatase